MNQIYKLELHDTFDAGGNLYVTRVPGGWLYESMAEQVGGHFASAITFVPFDNEFQKVIDNKEE